MAYTTVVVVASVSFGDIIAIFVMTLSGVVDKEEHVKACTFLLASAFVAAVSLGVVTSGTAWLDNKVKASTEFVMTVLACSSLGTLALFYQITA